MSAESLWQRIGAIMEHPSSVEGVMMQIEQSQAEAYRERAAAAEAWAAASTTDSLRDSWLSIARCYRQMAEQRIQTEMQ